MDISSRFNVISICSGSGAGDLAIRLAVPSARTVCYVEIEAHACASLVRSMEAHALAEAPVWTDARTFDGKPWRGRVDCVVATYPCQPFSCAGKRQGESDPRHIWPSIARIIEECNPPMVFLENVRGHLRIGFQSVCESLCRMGYEVRAGLFSSASVFAPHGRVRLFAMAVAQSADWRPEFSFNGYPPGRNGSGGRDRELAHIISPRLEGRGCEPEDTDGQCATAERSGDELADLQGGRLGELRESPGRDRQPAGSGGELERPYYFPPYRTGDWDRWADVLVRSPWLRPAISSAETECLFRRMVAGVADQLEFGRERIDRLRAVGEGITPLTMAFAFCILAKEHGIDLGRAVEPVLESELELVP